ncbi:MAG: DUF4411 family protein [Bacteroidetes bacterium]|nr:DUF4411 family protein [Bacteroidota bacterium]
MYLLDTNVFITAKNYYYPFDFHPGFWEWLIRGNQQGRIFSIQQVFDEICAGKDELTEWAHDHKSDFFLKNPPNLEIDLERISEYIKLSGYNAKDIRDFVSVADYYLIGQALTRKFKIVTLENRKPTKVKIKIPQVCKDLKVECLSPFVMLRQENAKFILSPQ